MVLVESSKILLAHPVLWPLPGPYVRCWQLAIFDVFANGLRVAFQTLRDFYHSQALNRIDGRF